MLKRYLKTMLIRLWSDELFTQNLHPFLIWFSVMMYMYTVYSMNWTHGLICFVFVIYIMTFISVIEFIFRVWSIVLCNDVINQLYKKDMNKIRRYQITIIQTQWSTDNMNTCWNVLHIAMQHTNMDMNCKHRSYFIFHYACVECPFNDIVHSLFSSLRLSDAYMRH